VKVSPDYSLLATGKPDQAHPVDSKYIALLMLMRQQPQYSVQYYNETGDAWEWTMSEGYRGTQEIERQICHKFFCTIKKGQKVNQLLRGGNGCP